jgi:hypothetical protein
LPYDEVLSCTEIRIPVLPDTAKAKRSLRVRGHLVAVTIDHHEFRTAGKSTAPARQELTVVAASVESLLACGGPRGSALFSD